MSPEPDFRTATLPLAENRQATIEWHGAFTPEDAERLCAMVASLVVETEESLRRKETT